MSNTKGQPPKQTTPRRQRSAEESQRLLERKRARKASRKSVNHGPNKVSLKMARISPRKARIVVDLIRGEDALDALRILRFSQRKGARLVEKLLESALSNMEASGNWDIDEVHVAQAWVNEGATLRRYQPRAMGRATRIRKRTSHIHLVLEGDDASSNGEASAQ